MFRINLKTPKRKCNAIDMFSEVIQNSYNSERDLLIFDKWYLG